MGGRIAAVAVAVLALGPAQAGAAPVQVAVKAKPPPVNERDGAAASGYLSWDQNGTSDPGHVNEYVQRAGRTPVRVNAAGTQGFGGGISGRTLVYQQVIGGRSDLRLFDLLTHHRTAPFAGVNTNLYEVHPTISGSWILFGRRAASGATSVLLANTATHAIRLLDRASPPGRVDPGQVSGDWAAWDRCSSRCNVFRYRISTRGLAKVPNPLLRFQLDPAVDSAGNVFYNRSGRRCGRGVHVMELPRGGSPRTLLALKTTNDTGRDVPERDEHGGRAPALLQVPLLDAELGRLPHRGALRPADVGPGPGLPGPGPGAQTVVRQTDWPGARSAAGSSTRTGPERSAAASASTPASPPTPSARR